MTKYAALIRGIGPGDPNMTNEKLRDVCESLGFQDVQTVISSGNVLFETDSTNPSDLETTLEEAWRRELGFERSTMIRSRDQLQDLADSNPFGDLEHGRETYLLVTFAKRPLSIDFDLPHQPPDRDYSILGGTDRELFTVTDTTSIGTPDVMAWLESRFGKDITSRTWLTVHRILKRMCG
ncbi:MAG: DUF1697 domain-containing protein [Acidimicrobiia bacterium]